MTSSLGRNRKLDLLRRSITIWLLCVVAAFLSGLSGALFMRGFNNCRDWDVLVAPCASENRMYAFDVLSWGALALLILSFILPVMFYRRRSPSEDLHVVNS